MNFYGARIIVQPDTITVKRGLFERLFARPWRPRERTKEVPNPVLLPDGQTSVVGDAMLMNRRTYTALTSTLRKQGKLTEATQWPAVAGGR